MKISELWRKLAKVHDSDSTDDDIGGLPVWFQFGDGSPVGTVTPSQKGALYQDTTNGALYDAVGVTNADWLLLGGVLNPYVVGIPGIQADNTPNIALVAKSSTTHNAQAFLATAGGWDETSGAAVVALEHTDGSGLIHLTTFDSNGAITVYNVDKDGLSKGGVVGNPHLRFSTDVPSDTVGNDNDWSLGADGHLYFKASGSWVQKV